MLGLDYTMTMLNSGCGTRTSSHPGVTNVDWSFYLRIQRNPVLRFLARRTFKGERPHSDGREYKASSLYMEVRK